MVKSIVRGAILLLPVAAILAGASAERRCNIPVFRYALERWAADPYAVTVLHRGTLSEADQETIALLEKYADGHANISVATDNPDKRNEGELPRFIVKYPDAYPEDPLVWEAKLTKENVEKMVDSPVRAKIARGILAGESAVWVLLEIGDKARDDAAEKTLKEQLALMQKTLKLPELTDDPEDELKFADAVPLNLSFSVVRLSREDAAEEVFVNMLLRTEDDLAGLKDPMAFPIFGRGRVLPALVGKGITAPNIEEYCAFIAGACSCQVKALNPGLDLLIKSEWVGEEIAEETTIELPPVILKPAEDATAKAAAAPAAAPGPAPAPEPAAPAPKEKQKGDSNSRTLLWAGVCAAGILALVTGVRAVVLSRKGNC